MTIDIASYLIGMAAGVAVIVLAIWRSEWIATWQPPMKLLAVGNVLAVVLFASKGHVLLAAIHVLLAAILAAIALGLLWRARA